jgi:ATP-dependent helicase/nuclease subunit A
MSSSDVPFEAEPGTRESRIDARDRAGRARAVDPRYNVALEASAGTGKTRVLVDRYVNLIRAGVDPANVLAITFTRKAAAEMRERVVTTLRAAAERGDIPAVRWRELRDRTGDIAISTVDAFCLSLLREFPLEADLDPGFSMADETEVPRLIDEALDRALRTCRHLASEDTNVALVFAQLGERRARAGLVTLLNRRIVAPRVLAEYLARGPRELDLAKTTSAAVSSVLDVFAGMPGGLDRFLACGPPDPAFALLARAVRKLADSVHVGATVDPAVVQVAFARLREHFLTQEGEPRMKVLVYPKARFTTEADWRAHRELVAEAAPSVRDASARYRRDLNVLASHGIRRMFHVADTEYRRTLEAHAVLDFSDVMLRTLDLLRQMEEFAQSRYRLESRYHHVLVDEFQDTSRAQWELVSLLVRSWGEGLGLAHSGPVPPSIFIVGDPKQSIYGFRDAEVSVLQEASRYLEALRPDGDVRRSISRNFRSVPGLLAFVNDLCQDMEKDGRRRDGFAYGEQDRFPIDVPAAEWSECLGTVLAETPELCAEMAAQEIGRLIASDTTIRDRDTGLRRLLRPGDIAILFRTRESHRAFEDALERRGVRSYVYKGLGFFDADEIKDMLALLWYLADPLSDLRAAAFMRSRVVRISDEGLRRLAPRLADALRAAEVPAAVATLDVADAAALGQARAASLGWRSLVDRLPPAELVDRVLNESAYVVEMRGPRFQQARENLKKMRALIRRIQNHGYVTLERLAAHLDRLAVGDEANASIDALDAVNLMTVHAAKGLEFPVVFLVNLARGTGNRREPIRIVADSDGDAPSVAVGNYQSEADADAVRRGREETKRLLYVAATRARDRLYLASTVRNGRVYPGRGSLAAVLPATLLEQLIVGAIVEWQASSGHVHRFRVCEAVETTSQRERGDGSRPQLEVTTVAIPTDFGAIDDLAAPRRSLTAAVAGDEPVTGRPTHGESGRLVGTLVHRVIQRVGCGAAPGAAAELAARLMRFEETGDSVDAGSLLEEVVAAYDALSRRPDVQRLYASGPVLHEVPFTMLAEGVWLRGTIDCVVKQSDTSLTVLEFKTGRPRETHRAQVDLYRRAVAQMFPKCVVDAHLVYAGSSVATGVPPRP